MKSPHWSPQQDCQRELWQQLFGLIGTNRQYDLEMLVAVVLQ